jgi:tRNA(Ile)-lysidine synthetase-like protein
LQRLPKTVTLCRELAERKVVISRRTCLNEPNLHSRERCREGGIDLDLTRLPEVVTLRSWRPGDTIRLPWSGHRRKLKRYFIDKKINKLQRGQSLVVQAGDRVVGVINDISVPGGTLVDHDYTLSRDSKDLLRIVLEGSNL